MNHLRQNQLSRVVQKLTALTRSEFQATKTEFLRQGAISLLSLLFCEKGFSQPAWGTKFRKQFCFITMLFLLTISRKNSH